MLDSGPNCAAILAHDDLEAIKNLTNTRVFDKSDTTTPVGHVNGRVYIITSTAPGVTRDRTSAIPEEESSADDSILAELQNYVQMIENAASVANAQWIQSYKECSAIHLWWRKYLVFLLRINQNIDIINAQPPNLPHVLHTLITCPNVIAFLGYSFPREKQIDWTMEAMQAAIAPLAQITVKSQSAFAKCISSFVAILEMGYNICRFSPNANI
ncbi:hypothetical protein HDU77_001215 [Chytriomyces hyalinus]|nr:hypothetical protein HDU77_001215 [Chytriomyces hyalinus]